ncbi:ChaN family lipoprotein [Desulfohalovibrio reitneri]|uniref:ChaN family lipoprotein n=1 Tax=Desulfohalovibrio reitneri TaxID=1307759 RepID=UPI0004A70E95|nr:ChaN family lipoprotein [Desulfohalovibrio reitneri]
MKYVAAVLAVLALSFSCGGEQGGFRVWEVARGGEASLAEVASELASNDIVYVGERHDEPLHHRGQVAVIRALLKETPRLAVGLEMWRSRDQKRLDAWVAGNVGEEEMRRAFNENWDDSWRLYRDIFLFCRDNGVPMVGLNMPREITRQVAREGFDSLTPAQRGELPPIVCEVAPAYEEYMRRVAGHGSHGLNFQHFCQAQLVWDTAMAVHAVDYLRANPGATMVVLCGQIHAWKPAMPTQVADIDSKLRQAVIMPQQPGRVDPGSVSSKDADYLLLGGR